MIIEMPPVMYDHEPRNYIVRSVSIEEVQKLCFTTSRPIPIEGCARPKWRLIVVDKDLPPLVKELVLRHEKAHLNGWIH